MISRSNSMTAFSRDSRPASVSSRSEVDRVSARKIVGRCSGRITLEPFGPDERLFDDVLHLAHVSRPGIVRNQLQRFFSKFLRGPLLFFDAFGEEVFGEQWDILAALA